MASRFASQPRQWARLLVGDETNVYLQHCRLIATIEHFLPVKQKAAHAGAHKGALVIDNGAHYHRCDFQVHSPRDRQWTGADCVTDEERMAYAIGLVEACREKGLNAIAITDHHDMTFIPFVKRAALAETDAKGAPLPPEEQLIVFPGIELTLAVPCQAILILDADFEDNRFGAV